MKQCTRLCSSLAQGTSQHIDAVTVVPSIFQFQETVKSWGPNHLSMLNSSNLKTLNARFFSRSKKGNEKSKRILNPQPQLTMDWQPRSMYPLWVVYLPYAPCTTSTTLPAQIRDQIERCLWDSDKWTLQQSNEDKTFVMPHSDCASFYFGVAKQTV